MDFVSFLGRLHPVVLHLPIGALFAIVVAEFWLRRSTARKDQSLLFSLYLFAALTALTSVATGLILSEEDAYGGSTLDLHEKLGIATGVATIILALLALVAFRASGSGLWTKARQLGLACSLVLITLTGHFGAEMTHGKGFLTEFGPAFLQEKEEAPEPVEITKDTTVFDAAIYPVLQTYCVYCHDADVTKGKLRMDSPELMLAGGSSGPLYIAGDIENSLMHQRIHLPLDDEEHMPPAKKPQPSEEEIAALVWWIESGASFELKLADATVPESIRALKPATTEGSAEDAFVPVAELDLQVVQELRDQLLTVQRIQQGEDRLWIKFSAVAPTAGDDFVEELLPLSNFVVWLDLARTQITDASMSTVAKMANLEELNLNACGITDAGIKQLEGLSHLKKLNLSGTMVSEAALPTLLKLEALEAIYLFRTQWTPEGVEVLRRIKPDVKIVLGE